MVLFFFHCETLVKLLNQYIMKKNTSEFIFFCLKSMFFKIFFLFWVYIFFNEIKNTLQSRLIFSSGVKKWNENPLCMRVILIIRRLLQKWYVPSLVDDGLSIRCVELVFNYTWQYSFTIVRKSLYRKIIGTNRFPLYSKTKNENRHSSTCFNCSKFIIYIWSPAVHARMNIVNTYRINWW